MSKKYIYLASHLSLYADKYDILKEKYKELLKIKDYTLVKNIENVYKKRDATKSAESFAYISNIMFDEEEKKNGGIEYTPSKIADLMSSFIITKYNSDNNLEKVKILDPAVGSGMLIISIINRLIETTKDDAIYFIENNIYGIDNSEFQLLIAEISLTILALEKTGVVPNKINLFNYDSFKLDKKILKTEFGIDEFDIVISNPPYIRSKNLLKDTRDYIKENYKETTTGLIDTYIPFFQVSSKLLRENGMAILITPNSYLTTNNAKNLREYMIKTSSEIKIVNFKNRQLFKNIMSYSAITFFKKDSRGLKENNIKFIEYAFNKQTKSFFENSEGQVDINDTWRILTVEDKRIIISLENKFDHNIRDLKLKNGIATQRNNIYAFKYDYKDEYFYYFKEGIEKIKIEKEVTRKFVTPNEKRPQNNQRIIFPYQHVQKDNKHIAISEQEMRKLYPNALSYLLSHKEELDNRSVDKNIPTWFAYGRSQGINDTGSRLYLPYIASKVHTIISSEDDELFAAGYAIYSNNREYLSFLGDILSSELFSYYISKVSKPYSQGYYSTAKSQIKNFSVPSEEYFEENLKNNWTRDQVFSLYGIDRNLINE